MYHSRRRPNFRRFPVRNNSRTISGIESLIERSKTTVSRPVVNEEAGGNFKDFDFPITLQQAISQCGFSQPTPIQQRVIPQVLAGMDIIGIANTGTGKTGAFLFPLITRLQRQQTHKVLIMTPTRELAEQIYTDFYRYAKGTKLKAVRAIGGTVIGQQIQRLKNAYDCLIGTPGRIKDMTNRGFIRLMDFDTVVLDEVDRMLDMGFIKEVAGLLKQLPSQRHSLFFSATLPAEVERLCNEFGHSPLKVSVKTTESAETIRQQIIRVTAGRQKVEVLTELLGNQQEFNKVLIFGRTKHGVKHLTEALNKRGFAADSIHGNKSQAARQRSLNNFKTDRVSILVATDVAARGIDIQNVSHIINYDIPQTIEDYIHRIGRTGRAGRKGVAVTLVETYH